MRCDASKRSPHRPRNRAPASSLLVALAVALPPAPLTAAPCAVPGERATVQAAVDDSGCSDIVLAAGSYPETVLIARDLTLRGATPATATIQGHVGIEGAETDVVLQDLDIVAGTPQLGICSSEALTVTGGASVDALRVDVTNLGSACTALFIDGFESGGTSSWSSTVP